MELYQELFNDYLKEYYKTFEELLNCLENDDKEKFQEKVNIFVYKKDNESEYIKDKNYIERLKLILSILYHKNMLVVKLTMAIFRLLKKLWHKLFSGIGQTLGGFFRSLPFVWRGVVAAAAVLLLEFLLTLLFLTGSWTGLFICLAVNLAVLVVAGMLLSQMKQLLDAGERMAGGDFDFRVDTDGMLQSFREHGDDLNAISEGMIHAVDQKMRSERMKTELITNVSHDIKTPLTSIVNYADLLSKEQPENERMRAFLNRL